MTCPHASRLAWSAALGLSLAWTTARAEQYIVKTNFHSYQPALFRVSVNGQPAALHANANGSLNITPLLRPGKNTLTVAWTPGKNLNPFSRSVLTLGAGQDGRWRTLFKREVGNNTGPGSVTYAFLARPTAAARPGRVVVFGKFHAYQPTQFEVSLNGELVASMNSDGNTDITPFLKRGDNTLSIRYVPGKNSNRFSQSVLTVGQQVGKQWNSVVKWAVGAAEQQPGEVTFRLRW